MNTVVPQAWIIQEKLRRDKERRRKEREGDPLPISLPVPDSKDDWEYPPSNRPVSEHPDERKQGTVIIIDI